MLTRQFWLGDSGVLVRSIRTFAQTAVAAVGVGQTNLFTADIKTVLSLATSAAILSLLMSLDRNTAATQVTVVEAAPTAAVQIPAAPAAGCGESLR